MFRYLLSLVTTFLVAIPISFANGDALPFAGWSYVVQKLKSDGIEEDLLSQVYDGVTVPTFDIVPFKLKPKESSALYTGLLSKKIVSRGKFCKETFADTFSQAEALFNVDSSVIASILLVETRCGQNVGKELVVNRLSRVASVKDPENLKKVFEEMHKEDDSVEFSALEARAQYLEDVFYPQLLSLFRLHEQGALDLFTLKGSIAGAFGWPQFLPQTALRYGVDADQNGHIDLFAPQDAILSIAHFLAANGWEPGISDTKKRAIIWRYNKSEPYIDTVLQLSIAIAGSG